VISDVAARIVSFPVDFHGFRPHAYAASMLTVAASTQK
jgi:hypothetical protein